MFFVFLCSAFAFETGSSYSSGFQSPSRQDAPVDGVLYFRGSVSSNTSLVVEGETIPLEATLLDSYIPMWTISPPEGGWPVAVDLRVEVEGNYAQSSGYTLEFQSDGHLAEDPGEVTFEVSTDEWIVHSTYAVRTASFSPITENPSPWMLITGEPEPHNSYPTGAEVFFFGDELEVDQHYTLYAGVSPRCVWMKVYSEDGYMVLHEKVCPEGEEPPELPEPEPEPEPEPTVPEDDSRVIEPMGSSASESECGCSSLQQGSSGWLSPLFALVVAARRRTFL